MVESVDAREDGSVGVSRCLLSTVVCLPTDEQLTRDVTAAVSRVEGVSAVEVHLGADDRRPSAAKSCARSCAAMRPRTRFRLPSRVHVTRVYAVASGKGGRWQVLGHRQPRGRPRRARGCRSASWSPTSTAPPSADARRHRHADPGRADDHAADGARREGHLHRHVHPRQRAGGPARADVAPGVAAVPGRRVLGRPGRAADGSSARDRRRRHLGGPAGPGRRTPRRHDPQLAAREVAERAGSLALQTHQQIVGVVEHLSPRARPHGSSRPSSAPSAAEAGAHALTRAHRGAGAAARPAAVHRRPAAAGGDLGVLLRSSAPGLARRRSS